MPTEQAAIETLERGRVYVFYRPRVEEEHPQGLDDLQNLYLVLSPREKQRHRLVIVGRKQLPDPAERGGARNWAFVQLVRKSPRSIADALSSETYQTKTRGERHRPAARPAGEGVYRIVRHGDHTHLVWFLDKPDRPGEVQRELNIEPTASYIVTVRRPGAPGPRQLGRGAEVKLPKRLRAQFRGRKFAELDPPDFLDHEGVELILIAAAEDPCEELQACDDPSATKTDVFEILALDRDEHPAEPLLRGTWA